jgi:hypothetical protein
MRFELIFLTVATVTVMSGGTAALMVTFGEQGRGNARRLVIERLTQIAVAGAVGLLALLARAAAN